MDGISAGNTYIPDRTLLTRTESAGTETTGSIGEDIKKKKDSILSTLDHFLPGSHWTEAELDIDSPEYKSVKTEDAAKMLGYFTQVMESEGFPWELHMPNKRTGLLGKFLPKMKKIGEFDALKRLQKGEPVIFKPKRVIGIGFSPPELKSQDFTGAESKGKMEFKSGGVEVGFGEPVAIKNFGQLKFLYELYNPAIEVNPTSDSEMKVAARELAYFTKGTINSQFPWKMFRPVTMGKKILNMVAGALKSGTIGAGVGAGIASILAMPAMALGATVGGPIGLGVGAIIGGVIGGFKGAMGKRNGEEVNAFEALSRLHKDEPVHFQEMKKREVGVAIPFPVNVQLGSLSFYTNHGEGSTISNLDELNLFHNIQEQQVEKKEEQQAQEGQKKKQ